MPAYMNRLELKCQKCFDPAIYEVFNTRNATMGVFCGTCADKKVKRLNDPRPPEPWHYPSADESKRV